MRVTQHGELKARGQAPRASVSSDGPAPRSSCRPAPCRRSRPAFRRSARRRPWSRRRRSSRGSAAIAVRSAAAILSSAICCAALDQIGGVGLRLGDQRRGFFLGMVEHRLRGLLPRRRSCAHIRRAAPRPRRAACFAVVELLADVGDLAVEPAGDRAHAALPDDDARGTPASRATPRWSRRCRRQCGSG